MAACGGGDGAPEITVAAASDLRPAFEEIAPAFERACDCRVRFIFGSSGNFATQIEGGLPVDVFASADVGYVDQLEAKGLVVAGSAQVYAIGRIVLAFPASAGRDLSSLDDLRDDGIGKIAIANPAHAPYGVAAREALTSAGVWDAVEARLVLAENASQAAQFVETGDAGAGIVPLSLAIQAGDALRYVPIDEALYAPLRQGAGIIARSDEPELAAAFLAFVNGPDGRPIMDRYGFVLPGASAP